MVGPKYMWIIHGNIRSRLATEDDRIECKAAQVMEASNLAITVGQLNYILENETTITGEVGKYTYTGGGGRGVVYL